MFNTGILLSIAVLLQFQLGNAEQRFVPNVPEECKRLGYCNQPQPDYPVEHVERLIETLGLQTANQSDNIEPMLKWDPQEVELCSYVEREFIPLVAQDANGNWNFIINSNHYRQTYRVQICDKQDVPCSSVAEFHIGYNASCAQNHIKKLVKAIDHKGKVIETERLIPSNCYCKVKQQKRDNHKYVESLLIKKDDRSENPENV